MSLRSEHRCVFVSRDKDDEVWDLWIDGRIEEYEIDSVDRKWALYRARVRDSIVSLWPFHGPQQETLASDL